MAKKSKAPDGDWQGDGWGVSWMDKNGQWQIYKSLLPVWEDRNAFGQIPKTAAFAVHARSASFPQHKGFLEFNQPYIAGKYSFVFNGLLRGVSLIIPGKIGAEKIWYLVQNELKKRKPQEALDAVADLLKQNSRQIVALNMGLLDKEEFYSFSYFTQFPEYYQLRSFQTEGFRVICSEDLQ